VEGVDAGDELVRTATAAAHDDGVDVPFGAAPEEGGAKASSSSSPRSGIHTDPSATTKARAVMARGGLYQPTDESTADTSGSRPSGDDDTPLLAVSMSARTHEARQLLAVARCVLRTRQAWRADNWEGAASGAAQLLDGGLVAELYAAEEDASQPDGQSGTAHQSSAGVAMSVAREAM